MPVLLPACVISAPYASMHDEVVLLVTVIQAAVWIVCHEQIHVRRVAIATYLALTVIALGLLPTLHYNQEWYVWLPLALLVWYLTIRHGVVEMTARKASGV